MLLYQDMRGSLLDSEWFAISTHLNECLVETIPYNTQRVLNCKLRWIGKTIYEIFRVEFALGAQYVDAACKCSKIVLNDGPCAGSDILANGDIISHAWVAVEPCITVCPHLLPRIIQNDQYSGIIAAFKPHSLPTVPQGKFFRLNLTTLMKRALNTTNIHPVNRLDRAVSGLVLFSSRPVSEISVTRKRYIAEVIDAFPAEVSESAMRLRVEKHAINQVLRTVIDELHGADSKTLFKKLSGNFVECQPITGRTHQIRVHLASLGYPIKGDSTYHSLDHNQMQQPEKIHLFCLEYEVTLNRSEKLVFTVPRECFPKWLPYEAVRNH